MTLLERAPDTVPTPAAAAIAQPDRSLWDLAKLGAQLRWRLSDNRMRRRGKRTHRLVHFMLAGYALVNIVALGSARFVSDETAAATVVLLMSSMAIGWVFGPVLIGGVDETVDPTRLALLPLSDRERYVVQLAGAFTGVGPIAATVGVVVGLIAGHIGLGISLLVVPLAAVIAVLAMVGSARSLAAVLAIALRSRTGRDVAVLLAALVGGTMFTLAQLARDVVSVTDAAVFKILAWLPWAWPAQAINAARSGEVLPAIGWLVAAAMFAFAMHRVWIALSTNLLLNGEKSAAGRRPSGRNVLNGARSKFTGSLARQFVYLRRSPNNRVGFVYGTVFGVAFAMVQIVQQGEGSQVAAVFGILLAMLANLGAATNTLGFDAGSLWISVLAGGPDRVNMIARQLIVLPNLLLPTWISGVIVGFWTGLWELTALVALVAIPVAVNMLTFGLVTSVVVPAPMPDWDNPFGNRQGNEGRASRLLFIAAGGIVWVLLASFPLFIALFRLLGTAWVWAVPLIGVAYTGAIFLAVAVWAGRYLRGREPKLIERLAPRALN